MNEPNRQGGGARGSMSLPPDHPQRIRLHNEVHARPPEQFRAPTRLSFLALYSAPEEQAAQIRDIGALCEQFGQSRPAVDANHFSTDLGPFRIKWERHTEYARYKFIVTGDVAAPFDGAAIEAVPEEFVKTLRGEVIAAAHVDILPAEHPVFLAQTGIVENCFPGKPVIGASVASGAATAWTDFHLYEDGFSRWLIRDNGLTPRQAGRTVQRLLEIDIYRMLALLALPMANSMLPKLDRYERELERITESLSMRGETDEGELLDQLTKLQGEIENGASRSAYRFSAAHAYHDLVKRRVADLREERLPGLQTFNEFIERRLAPAMNTCVSVGERQSALLERVSRSTMLLSTRVDIIRQEQTQALLESMNKRAKMQLRLQETVEGLSVAAITYYVVGLVGYAAKSLKAAGVPLNADLATGAAIPVVAIALAVAVRSIRHSVSRKLT